jgi:predicted site-specific integrase-resolvase
MGVGRGATRVAIYARVSTGEQTPELKLRELRDYAGRRKRTPTPSGNIA